jgi:hypothetical protein
VSWVEVTACLRIAELAELAALRVLAEFRLGFPPQPQQNEKQVLRLAALAQDDSGEDGASGLDGREER